MFKKKPEKQILPKKLLYVNYVSLWVHVVQLLGDMV